MDTLLHYWPLIVSALCIAVTWGAVRTQLANTPTKTEFTQALASIQSSQLKASDVELLINAALTNLELRLTQKELDHEKERTRQGRRGTDRA